MAKLIYSVICSLDGYLADESGDFSWAFPDEQIHRHANEEMRHVSVQLLGRRLYEMMVPWENDDELITGDAPSQEFAQYWQDTDKLVYSSTLDHPLTNRTSIRRSLDAAEVRGLKADASGELVIGGPTLAAKAFAAELIDEVRMVVMQVTIGGGLPVFPTDQRVQLALLESRTFDSGALGLTYRVLAGH